MHCVIYANTNESEQIRESERRGGGGGVKMKEMADLKTLFKELKRHSSSSPECPHFGSSSVQHHTCILNVSHYYVIHADDRYMNSSNEF